MNQADLLKLMLVPIVVAGSVLIYRTGRHVAGRLLVLIGALHLCGGWVARDALQRMVAGGIVNQAESGVGTIPVMAEQELAFWFLLWGALTIMLGQLVIAMEKRGVEPPRWWGAQLLLINLVCAALLPKSGFWWVALPAWLIMRGTSESGARTPARRLPRVDVAGSALTGANPLSS